MKSTHQIYTLLDCKMFNRLTISLMSEFSALTLLAGRTFDLHKMQKLSKRFSTVISGGNRQCRFSWEMAVKTANSFASGV